MFPQIACLRGGIVALVAFVWFFSAVYFQMFSQIACPRKDIFTLVAFVYFNDIVSHFLRDFYTCTVQVVPFEAKSWFSISSIAIVCCSLPKRLLQSESNLSFNFGLKGKISHDILSLFLSTLLHCIFKFDPDSMNKYYFRRWYILCQRLVCIPFMQLHGYL